MAAEHHIESFDEPAFFKLHDLDLDGFWDRDEIAAIYGLRHHSLSAAKEHPKHDKDFEERVVAAVLSKLDTDGDGGFLLWAGMRYATPPAAGAT